MADWFGNIIQGVRNFFSPQQSSQQSVVSVDSEMLSDKSFQHAYPQFFTQGKDGVLRLNPSSTGLARQAYYRWDQSPTEQDRVSVVKQVSDAQQGGAKTEEVKKQYLTTPLGLINYVADAVSNDVTVEVPIQDQVEEFTPGVLHDLRRVSRDPHNPLGFAYQVVAPSAAVAAGLVYGLPALTSKGGYALQVVTKHPQFAKSIVGNTIKRGWGPFVENMAIGVAAGEGLNEGLRLTTGKDWGEHGESLLGISSHIMDWTNPGYFVGGVRGIRNSSKKLDEERQRKLSYKFWNKARKKGGTGEFSPLEEIDLTLIPRIKSMKHLYKDLKEYQNYKLAVNNLLKDVGSMPNKIADMIYNFKKDRIRTSSKLFQRRLREFTDGDIELSDGLYPSHFNFRMVGKAYDVTIPNSTRVFMRLGSDVRGSFALATNGSSALARKRDFLKHISISEIHPEIITNNKEFKDVLDSNISRIQQLFPGAKPMGSSILYSRNASSHIPHDIDMYITKEDLEAALHSNKELLLKIRDKFGLTYDKSPGELTYTYTVGGDNVDLNVVSVSKNGVGNDRALQLYRQWYPDEYHEQFRKVGSIDFKSGTIKILGKDGQPLTAKQLLEKADPVTSSILDILESNKYKHAGKVIQILSGDAVEETHNALSQLAKILYGGRGQLLPRLKFGDIEYNKTLLYDLGFKLNNDALNKIASSRERMQNVLDYWYLQHGGVSRNTKANLQSNVAVDGWKKNINSWNGRPIWNSPDNYQNLQAGVMNGWSPITGGGDASGSGLNAVLGYGNSGARRDFIIFMQPKIDGLYEDMPAKDAVHLITRKMGNCYDFTTEEKKEVNDILEKWIGKHIEVNSARGLQYPGQHGIYDKEKYSEALKEIADRLNIFSYTDNFDYLSSGSKFVGILGKNNNRTANIGYFINNPRYRHEGYTGNYPVYLGGNPFSVVVNHERIGITNKLNEKLNQLFTELTRSPNIRDNFELYRRWLNIVVKDKRFRKRYERDPEHSEMQAFKIRLNLIPRTKLDELDLWKKLLDTRYKYK